jgi:hypothetical protein
VTPQQLTHTITVTIGLFLYDLTLPDIKGASKALYTEEPVTVTL